MKNIEWIFFDVGSTLVNEINTYEQRAIKMIENTSITIEEYDKKRIEFLKCGLDGDKSCIEYFKLKRTPWPSQFDVIYPHTYQTLKTLKERGYKIGIIANQPIGTKTRLISFGLGDFIDEVTSSAEEGLEKPDERFFLRGLELANTSADKSIMIGDRLDNDIKPAKKLGFKTIWIRQGYSSFIPKEYGKDVSDFIVDDLLDVLDILK